MIKRDIWLQQIEKLWKKRSIIWLSGVRRIGKTTLAKMLNAEYINCDLPSSQERLENPEFFLRSLKKNTYLILDEVHQLKDPSLLLKIAADEFSTIKILATGSSTLSATSKFRDSLTGRKMNMYLSPVLWNESKNYFNVRDLKHRLLRGGLPGFLLEENRDESYYSEWIDSFYARDISELFSIRNREGFLKVLQLLMKQSGGLLDYTNIAKLAQVSRPTVKTYIESMQIANAIHIILPYHNGGKREIIQMPKCYAFDTGFVAYARGWDSIRTDDEGTLWEHLVLDILLFCFDNSMIFYWRNKSKLEIDFVIKRKNNKVDIIECKMNVKKINIQALKEFRTYYPEGTNYLISPYTDKLGVIMLDGLEIQIENVDVFIEKNRMN